VPRRLNWQYMPMFGYAGNTISSKAIPVASAAQPGYTASPHFNVMNIALGDGSVRSVTRAMAQLTWQYAIIPDDGNPMPSDW